MRQGKIFFEKKLATSCLPPRSTMTLPKLFVQQHGDKIHTYVTLRNVADGKMWTVKINIMFSHIQPKVTFYRGWKDFTASNTLVTGDRLTFVLVGKSFFDVFILRRGARPGFHVQNAKPIQDPLPVQRETEMSPAPHHCCKISADGCQISESPAREGNLPTKDPALEIFENKVASESPDSSPRASDMESHYFEPVQVVHEEDPEYVSTAVNSSSRHDQDQSTLPHFLKRTTMSNNLEIPYSFLRMHHSRLGPRVQLQGIHNESPECAVACCPSNQNGRLRVFLRSGWVSFVNDNSLPVGQSLLFTLTADSFFVVRRI